MSQILDNIYIWVFFVNSESVLLLAFVKYMLYSDCTENCIFGTFWRLKTLVLWWKMVQDLLIFVDLFRPKNSTIDSRKTSITPGAVGRRKLPNPSLNHIFNALSIGVQNMLLFQWINFGLKCLFQDWLEFWCWGYELDLYWKGYCPLLLLESDRASNEHSETVALFVDSGGRWGLESAWFWFFCIFLFQCSCFCFTYSLTVIWIAPNWLLLVFCYNCPAPFCWIHNLD